MKTRSSAGESVEPVSNTNLVKINFIHPDPELAQKVANTLAEVFVNNNLQRATAGSSKAEDILAKEIATLQTKIKQEQEEQFNYAKNHNLPLTADASGNLEADTAGHAQWPIAASRKRSQTGPGAAGSSQKESQILFLYLM